MCRSRGGPPGRGYRAAMGHVAITAMGDGSYYADHDERERQVADEAGGYYVKGREDGEAPGLFLGAGLEMLGISRHESAERSDELMKTTWTNLTHPETGESLGTAPRHYAGAAENLAKAAVAAGLDLGPEVLPAVAKSGKASLANIEAAIAEVVTPEEAAALSYEAQASQRHSRSFYDFTYSADKSVSVAHVAAELAGDVELSEALEASTTVAIEAVFDYAAADLTVSRVGFHGKSVGGQTSGRRVVNRGLVMAVHMHHTSREGDPQDHAHGVMLNRGYDETGTWHALDGQALYLARASLEARGSRVQELHLANTLGLRFESDGKGNRRIVGVDQQTCDLFSKRSAVIEAKVEAWVEAFTKAKGKAPTALQRTQKKNVIARQSRKVKDHVERGVAVEAYGEEADERGLSLQEVHKDLYVAMKAAKKDQSTNALFDGMYDTEVVLSKALDTVSKRQSKWNRHHLYAAVDAQLPDNWAPGTTPEQVHQITLSLTSLGLQREGISCLTPEQPIDLQVPVEMADGKGLSMFFAHGRETYVPTATLDAEASILCEVHRLGAPSLTAAASEDAAWGAGLSEDQADAVAGILSSGRNLEALIGPAGTGKSYALAKLVELWPTLDGASNVVGLTTSQNAAEVLKVEGFEAAVNIERWLGYQDKIAKYQRRHVPLRDYLKAFVVTPGQMLVVDEASMASTEHLGQIIALARANGAKVLLAGDDRQLDAVGAGGALSMLAGDLTLREAGAIHELHQVRRFRDPDGSVRQWEADASLGLREGSVGALSAYDDHGRLVAGTAEEMATQAVEEIVAAHLSGKLATLVAGTGEEAAGLSWRVRAGLIETGRVSDGARVALRDGTAASVGDLVMARANSHEVKDEMGVAISNRDTLVVTSIEVDGSIRTRRRLSDGTLGLRVTLDSDYVHDSVELAYAATVHASQGRTVDVGVSLVDPEQAGSDRAHVYVGMTRGRESNRAYVVASAARASLTPIELMTEVLERNERAVSATEMKRDEEDAAVSLARVGPVWNEAMALIAARSAASGYRSVVDARLEEAGVLSEFRLDPAAQAFWEVAAVRQAEGIDVGDAVASTLAGREIDTSRSVAQVLHHRLSNMAHMAWEPSCVEARPGLSTIGSYAQRCPEPESLTRELVSDQLGSYARRLAGVLDARVAELGRRTAAQVPAWAEKHLGPLPRAGTSDWDNWCERAGAAAAYREHYGDDGPIDAADPIGRAPSQRRDPGRYAEWSRAAEALNLGGLQQVKDPAMRSDGDLQRRVQVWSEAIDVAPAYVKPLLDRAHADHRSKANEFAREAARAKVFGPRMRALETEVDKAAAKVEDLQAQHDERARWYSDTKALREEAQEARVELSKRVEDGLSATPPTVVREDMDDRSAKRYDSAVIDDFREQQRRQEQARQDDSGMSMQMDMGY